MEHKDIEFCKGKCMENKSSKVNKECCGKCNAWGCKRGWRMEICPCHFPTPDTEVAQCLNCHLKFTEWLSDSKECPECEGKVVFFDCLSPTPDTINEDSWSCKWCGGTNIKPPLFGEPENEDWESEFEKMLCNCGTSDFTNHGKLCGYRYYGQQNVNIKSFIKSLISKQKAEFIEKIEGVRRKPFKPKDVEWDLDEEDYGYNQALDDLLTSLTKE